MRLTWFGMQALPQPSIGSVESLAQEMSQLETCLALECCAFAVRVRLDVIENCSLCDPYSAMSQKQELFRDAELFDDLASVSLTSRQASCSRRANEQDFM